MSSPGETGPWFLRPDAVYEVVEEFEDYDGQRHPTGETWRYLGSSFLPYEDGACLFVSVDGRPKQCIRLQWREATQGRVLERFARHVAEVPPSPS